MQTPSLSNWYNFRMVDGHIQDFSALSSYMQQFTPDCFLQAVSDFHFLLYISTMDMLPMKVCGMSNVYMIGLTNNWADSVIYLFVFLFIYLLIVTNYSKCGHLQITLLLTLIMLLWTSGGSEWAPIKFLVWDLGKVTGDQIRQEPFWDRLSSTFWFWLTSVSQFFSCRPYSQK